MPTSRDFTTGSGAASASLPGVLAEKAKGTPPALLAVAARQLFPCAISHVPPSELP
jgi:hypothetical protein